MRLGHFDTLRPLCPVCIRSANEEYPLRLAAVFREQGELVIEGLLHCSNEHCQREYPIIDGIPLIICDLRDYLSNNAFQVNSRRDLSEPLESVLGDCCGPGSPFEAARQQLSSYTWDHYGDRDPDETGEPAPGSVVRVLQRGLELLEDRLNGPILDAGCGVGRSTFELAERSQQLVLGVDLNYTMLRLAQDVLRTERVCYPRRRVGVVYDRRVFPVRFEQAEQVDFWACDAAALPFANAQFSAAISLNTLDSIHAPLGMLHNLGRVLRADCPAMIACPYDWTTSATPLEAWLGGHSQRSPGQGASEEVLRRLLATERSEPSIGLTLVAEGEELWNVRMHQRSLVQYRTHIVVARADGQN